MMDEHNLTSVIEKIKKLLALSTSSNPHESALAAAKAQELLAEYNLELSHVQAGEPTAHYTEGMILTGRRVWRRHLLYLLATYNFCESFYDAGKKCMVLIGERHNREVVQYLYEYLAVELEHLALAAYERTYSELPAVTWRDSFYMGALDTLYVRLRAEQSKFTATSHECRALVTVKNEELQKTVRERYPDLHPGRAKRVALCDGYYDGKQAGNAVSLHRAIEH